jgi:hypothetical protein
MLMLASSMLPNNVIRCAKAHSTGDFRRESRFQLDFCDMLVVSAFEQIPKTLDELTGPALLPTFTGTV